MNPFVTLVLGVCHHLYPLPSLQSDDFFDFGQLLYTLYHEQFHVSHFHLFKTSSPLLSLSLLKVNLPKMTIKSIESETFRWLVPFHQECLWDLRVHRETAVVPKLRTRMMINKSTDFAVYIWFICNSYRLYRHTYALTHRSIKDNVSIGISSIGRFLGSKARLTLLFLLMVSCLISLRTWRGLSSSSFEPLNWQVTDLRNVSVIEIKLSKAPTNRRISQDFCWIPWSVGSDWNLFGFPKYLDFFWGYWQEMDFLKLYNLKKFHLDRHVP